MAQNSSKQQLKSSKSYTIKIGILIFFIMGGLIFWYRPSAFALDNFSYDCGITVGTKDNISRAKWVDNAGGVLDKNSLEMAFLHLKNHCNYIVWWAESNLLFDHLIDMWFRRLDAYENENLRYKLASDSVWSGWIAKLNEFTDTKKTTTPEQIINAYVEFWWDDPQITIDTPNSGTCAVKNYDQLNLYKRYLATCEMARCISLKKTVVVQEWIMYTSAALVKTDRCESIVSARKETELAFVRQLTARSALRTTESLFTSYTNTYFKSRWSDLYENFTAFDQWLTFVNRKIQEWTATCSK